MTNRTSGHLKGGGGVKIKNRELQVAEAESYWKFSSRKRVKTPQGDTRKQDPRCHRKILHQPETSEPVRATRLRKNPHTEKNQYSKNPQKGPLNQILILVANSCRGHEKKKGAPHFFHCLNGQDVLTTSF